MSEQVSERAKPFRDMADVIELNLGKPFGGAVVIIPPGDQAKSIEMLVLDSREDGLAFYTSIKTMAEVAYNELLREQQKKEAFYGVR